MPRPQAVLVYFLTSRRHLPRRSDAFGAAHAALDALDLQLGASGVVGQGRLPAFGEDGAAGADGPGGGAVVAPEGREEDLRVGLRAQRRVAPGHDASRV